MNDKSYLKAEREYSGLKLSATVAVSLTSAGEIQSSLVSLVDTLDKTANEILNRGLASVSESTQKNVVSESTQESAESFDHRQEANKKDIVNRAKGRFSDVKGKNVADVPVIEKSSTDEKKTTKKKATRRKTTKKKTSPAAGTGFKKRKESVKEEPPEIPPSMSKDAALEKFQDIFDTQLMEELGNDAYDDMSEKDYEGRVLELVGVKSTDDLNADVLIHAIEKLTGAHK